MFLKMIGYTSHDETSSRTTGVLAGGLAFPSTSNVTSNASRGNLAFGFAGIPSTQRYGNF